jgi:hypothetical protein
MGPVVGRDPLVAAGWVMLLRDLRHRQLRRRAASPQ